MPTARAASKTGAMVSGLKPGERYTACTPCPSTSSFEKGPDTNCTCGNSVCKVTSCGGAARVSATVMLEAPARTHQRAMARPEAPKPRIRMFWPTAPISGMLGGRGFCAGKGGACVAGGGHGAEPSAPSPSGAATESSAKMRATKSAASCAAVSVVGKARAASFALGSGSCTCAVATTCSGSTGSAGATSCMSFVFIAISGWTNPPDTAAW